MSKEKILLINPGYKNKYIVYFPLGLGYLAGACAQEGIEVECIDVNASNFDKIKILEIINKNNHHVVGIGGFITQLRLSIELTDFIKTRCQDVSVILGGGQVVGCEEFIMNSSKADIIGVGESEQILPQIVHALYSDKDYSRIPQIVYRKNGEIVKSTTDCLKRMNLDEIPPPKYDIFQMEKYITSNYHSIPGKRTIDFICSRGCAYSCSYCINSKKKVQVRYRSPENILQEIRFLKKKYSISDFSFSDENFTVNKNRAYEICEALKNENITWLTSSRADSLDGELISAMKDSGCRMLLIGFESGSEPILKLMNKRVSLEVYSNTINLLREKGMLFYSNFMIGMPGETEGTVRETEKFCIDHGLIYGPSYATPFPGTILYDEVKERIVDKKKYLFSLSDMDFAKEPIVNLTEMPTKQLTFIRNRTVVNTIAHIISEKLKFIPMSLIMIACWFYLYIFNLKDPRISRVLRVINKIVHRVVSPSAKN